MLQIRKFILYENKKEKQLKQSIIWHDFGNFS